MTSHTTPTALAASFALALFAALAAPLSALAADPVYSNWRGLAIAGTDPVAYFVEGRAVEGDADHALEYMGATWHFASADNKAAFERDPERYVPEYGGYCAWAVSQGYTARIDPEAFTIVGDKLYLNYDQNVMKKWLGDRDAFIAEADANWPGLRDG